MRNERLSAYLYAKLEEALAELLEVEALTLPPEATFLQLGLDSSRSVDFVLTLNERLGLAVGIEKIFEHSRVDAFARYVLENFADQLGSAPDGAGEAEAGAPAEGARAEAARPSDVAVIGLSLRAPDADDAETFWANLRAGVCSSRAVSRGPHGSAAEGQARMALLEGVDSFDAGFFAVTDAEAASMDPQQRVLLEESWRAIEDAGYAPNALAKSLSGVFVGAMGHDYELWGDDEVTASELVGNSASFLAGRLADFFDFKGPALTLDTACSSALVALDAACRALRSGEVETALVGGVSLCLRERSYERMRRAGMLSESGLCRPFDNAADGFVPGEACAVLFLKPLDRALADGDHIYGVIKATGVSHSGRTQGATAPSAGSQTELQRRVLASAGWDPRDLTYVEAHATGTKFGDAIEAASLIDSFGSPTAGRASCALGSVKGNVGHPTAASGMLGLIKVLLCMRARELAPTIHLNEINEFIKLDASPFYINTEAGPWPCGPGRVRRAAVNSYGFSGTSAFVLVEEAPGHEPEPARPATAPGVVAVSARTQASLRDYLKRLVRWLRGPGVDAALEQIAFTLCCGRQHFGWREAFVVSSVAELADAVAASMTKERSGEHSTRRALPSEAERRAAALAREVAASADGAGRREKLSELAALYRAGAEVDWAALYTQGHPGRIALPTYAFEKCSHWRGQAAWPPERRAAVAAEQEPTAAARLESYSRELILNAFQQKGCFVSRGERRSKHELRGAFSVRPSHERLFDALLDMLSRGGWVFFEGEEVIARAEVEGRGGRVRPRDAGEELRRTSPESEPYLRLLETCVGSLWQVVAGELSALDVLLPSGSLELLSAVYSGHPAVEAMLGRAAAVVGEAVARKAREGVARVLEVGAGTGSASAHVLPALAPYAGGVEYLYTDISAAFLNHGQERFARRYPFVSFCRFDIDRDAGQQGFEPQQFDVICAVNVLHTAARLGDSLARLESLLAPGGLLVVCELTGPSDFLTVTFGLTDGWWAFEQQAGRLPHAPLLSADSWAALLRERGWGLLDMRGVEAEELLPQTLFVATRPDATRAQSDPAAAHGRGARPAEFYETVLGRLVRAVAEAASVAVDEVDPERRLADYGLKSLAAVRLAQRLAEELGAAVRPLDVFDYPGIGELAEYIAARRGGGSPANTSGITDDASAPSPKRSAPATPEPVAVVGMSGRFPGARNVTELWDNLCQGRSSITPVPPGRWKLDEAPRREHPGGNPYWNYGGFLSEIDRFDALFFNFSGAEAEHTDPQQRLFLEECWRAIEDAGHDPRSLSGRNVGVFVGCGAGDYRQVLREGGEISDPHTLVGNEGSILASRIAYHLDLRGPSLAVDTSCSSSLVAIHLACQSLARGESEMALAGGVFVACTPDYQRVWAAAGMLAGDGRCKAFDEAADGFVPGEAVVALLLKPLSRAVADGDYIYGTILASGVNQDGKTNGITAPSGRAQRDLISEVYGKAGVEAESIGYVEAHGTGTRLGDPIEVDALGCAFKTSPAKTQYCALGSVKTNLGHTIFAAGAVGVVKALLCLRHRKLVPSLNLSQENSRIDFAATPFYPNTRLRDWPSDPKHLRRAAVSSFGISGVNAHVILEEAAPGAPRETFPRRPAELVKVSAKTHEALAARRAELADWLERADAAHDFGDIIYTLNVGRSDLPARAAFVVEGLEDLIARLREPGPSETPTPAAPGVQARAEELSAQLKERGDDAVEQLQELARLYVAGAKIDWQGLYAGRRASRVPLPTYPFFGERYWAAAREEDGGSRAGASLANPPDEAVGEGDSRLIYYRNEWVEAAARAGGEVPTPILLFDRDESLAGGLRRLFGDSQVISVRPGDSFRERALNDHEVAPGESGDYRELLSRLAARETLPRSVIHAWNADAPALDFRAGEADHLVGSLQEQMRFGVGSLLRLSKALLNEQRRPRELSLLSVHRSRGGETPPHQEALGAFARSLRLEAPAVSCKVLGVEDDGDLIPHLVRELRSRDDEPEVLFRRGTRLVRRLSEIDPEQAGPAAPLPLHWRGVYLITGGAGKLGLLVAGLLAKQYQARLLLVGRSPLSLAGRQALARIEALGGEVIYERADVTRPEEVRAALEQCRRRFGRVEGVFHAAGLLSDAFILKADEAVYEEVLAPKVRGTVVLDAVIRQDDPDFFVMFSSLAAVFGNAGQSGHAFANSFMDRYAELRLLLNGRRKLTLSVNWPLWEEGGTTLGREDLEALFAQTGIRPVPTPLALRAFQNVLAREKGSVAVFYGRRGHLEPHAPEAARDRVAEDQPAAAEGLRERLTGHVVRLIASELRVPADRIDPAENLEAYGLDSLVTRKLMAPLERDFGPLSKTLLFEYKTVSRLCEYFLEHHGQEARALLAQGEPHGDVDNIEPAAPPLRPAPAPVGEPHSSARGATPVLRQSPGDEARSEIAVVGFSGRLPMAPDVDAFWRNLLEGRRCVTPLPAGRWTAESIPVGGYLEGFDEFDPLLFNISPAEARTMDPQERLFLQAVWATLEHAGYTRRELNRRARGGVGTFVGVTSNTYQLVGLEAWRGGSGDAILPEAPIWTVANRVSYFNDFSGPSLSIDTACSSSLTALHWACESIRSGQCDAAVVGGVNLYVHPYRHFILGQRRLLSGAGASRAFDADGDGFVPAEAVGALLLRPLADAQRDGDFIHGVIRGTAVGSAGRTNGYSAPDPQSFERVVVGALKRAGVDARTIGYVEAQALGSELGDAVEVEGLAAAFRHDTLETGFCAIGSLKPNMGHAESAADIAKLFKVLLQFRHRQLAPTLLAADFRPTVDFGPTPFVLQDRPAGWRPMAVGDREGQDAPRRALVSSIGGGGAVAAAVLEEPPARREEVEEPASARPQLIVISARTADALRRAAGNLARFVEESEAGGGARVSLRDIAYTLQVGREPLAERLAVVAASGRHLLNSLQAFLRGEPARDDVFRGRAESGAGRPPAPSGAALRTLAAFWCDGSEVDWESLYQGGPMKRIPLPTYPFDSERYWLTVDEGAAAAAPVPAGTGSEAVSRYYDDATRLFHAPSRHLRYLTLAPFDKKVEGFSWLMTFARAEEYPEQMRLVVEKQEEMRRKLFASVDFNSLRHVLDIGCGLGTDLIEIGSSYPHLMVDGYTISGQQYDFARGDIEAKGLARVRVFRRDSSRDPFPAEYDLIYGVEVCHHVPYKEGLYGNIAAHLREGGQLRLADTIALTAADINLDSVGAYTPCVARYAELMARNGLVIDECVDASPEIARFLDDPGFEEHVRLTATTDNRSLVTAQHRGWHNYGKALNEGLVAYVLLYARKAAGDIPYEELFRRNVERLEHRRPYADVPAAADYLQPAPTRPAPSGQTETEEPAGGALGRERRLDALRTEVAAAVCQVLGTAAADLSPSAPFAEYGVDSLRALQLVEKLNRRFALSLPVEVVFDHATLDRLAGHLLGLGVEVKAAGGASSAAAEAEPAARVAPPRAAVEPFTAAVARPPADDAVAVIGMSCRFPGARDYTEFWRNLAAGVDSVREVPPQRWDPNLHYDSDPQAPGKSVSRWGGFLDGIEEFDAPFFEVAPKIAAVMDPHQRILLEQCWLALDDAGYGGESVRGRSCGVFIGFAANPSQSTFQASEDPLDDAQGMLGHSLSILSSRISYLLDLKGPALTIDTACSSSLVALHVAAEQIRGGEIEMALVGGVSLYLDPRTFVSLSKLQMLSANGRCRPFDARADGITVGEGAGVLVLKSLRKAIEDGDAIDGVILGSAVNQDGRTNGITAPSKVSQVALEAGLYRQRAISPETISYVEAHGTGTPLGDPIEVNALSEAFRQFTDRRQFCALGSVKANIGHTTAAAGVAGLIKVLLALRHGKLPPSIHFEEPNPHIELADSPFYVNRDLREWQPGPTPRRAAVSSFGWSGTNAHVVIQEPPRPWPRVEGDGRPALVPLSAHSPEALVARVRELRDWLTLHKDAELADVAFTLGVGRSHLRWRAALVAHSIDDLTAQLDALCTGDAADTYRDNMRLDGAVSARAVLRHLTRTLTLEIRKGRAEEAAEKLLALAELYALGNDVGWEQLYEGQRRRRLHLPGHVFIRQRYPIRREAAPAPHGPAARRRGAPVDEIVIRPDRVLYRKRFAADDPTVCDHRVEGRTVLSSSVGLWLALAAAENEARPGQVVELSNVTFPAPIILGESDDSVELEVSLAAGGPGDYVCSARLSGREITHATGRTAAGGRQQVSESNLPTRGAGRVLEAEAVYDALRERGLDYGPSYRLLESVTITEQGVVGEVNFPDEGQGSGITPAPQILDATLQAAAFLRSPRGALQPFALERVLVWSRPRGRCRVLAQAVAGDGRLVFDLRLFDEAGALLVEFSGFTAIEAGAAAGPLHVVEAEVAAAAPSASPSREPAQTQPADLAAAVGECLRGHLAGCLGLAPEQVDDEGRFKEFGVDSIVSLELTRRVNDEFGLQLRPTLLFDYSSVGDLMSHLLAAHGRELREWLARRLPPAAPSEEDEDAAALELLRQVEAGGVSVNEAMRRMPVKW